MGDEDDDDLDGMWDELDGGDDNDMSANVSGNLAELLNMQASIVHKDDVDEGRVTWEPPAFHGLDNSDEVTISTKHWYKEDEDVAAERAAAAPSAAPAIKVQTDAGTLFFNPTGLPNVPFTMGTFGAPAADASAPAAPFSMFTFDENGRIKW